MASFRARRKGAFQYEHGGGRGHVSVIAQHVPSMDQFALADVLGNRDGFEDFAPARVGYDATQAVKAKPVPGKKQLDSFTPFITGEFWNLRAHDDAKAVFLD